MKYRIIVALSILTVLTECKTQWNKRDMSELLIIKEQGSFTVGGTIIQNPETNDALKFDNFKPQPEGQTFHGDHDYVFYQMPDKA